MDQGRSTRKWRKTEPASYGTVPLRSRTLLIVREIEGQLHEAAGEAHTPTPPRMSRAPVVNNRIGPFCLVQDWEQSTDRTLKGGSAQGLDLPKGPNGRNLCRWCQLEVPATRRTFCSGFCVNEWRLRTDPSYLRGQTFARDRGICAVCGTDTVAAWKELRRSRGTTRIRLLREWGLTSFTRRSLWDADHIVPVVEGGGACDLSNIRTLCLCCHRKATAELRSRRAVQ